MGTPTIEKLYFYSGKFAVLITWVMFIIKASFPGSGYIYMPDSISWFAVILLYIGVIIILIAFIHLGKALTVGLPEQPTSLQTRGIYRMSRNPLYVGVHVIMFASCLYFPDLINVSFTLYGIVIHHRIIKQEENFLAGRFGTDWMIYSARVSRYV